MNIEKLKELMIEFDLFIENQEKQLNAYKKKENANQYFIKNKEKEILFLINFINTLQQFIEKIEQEKLKLNITKNYDEALNRKNLYNNTYHAGTFIKEYFNALKKIHNNGTK